MTGCPACGKDQQHQASRTLLPYTREHEVLVTEVVDSILIGFDRRWEPMLLRLERRHRHYVLVFGNYCCPQLLPPVRREHELAGHFRKTSCKANASRALGFNMCQRAILSEIMSCPTMSRRHFLTYRLIFRGGFYHVYYHLLESSYVPERGRMLESTKQGNMIEPDNAIFS
jgi:hypothetical protein